MRLGPARAALAFLAFAALATGPAAAIIVPYDGPQPTDPVLDEVLPERGMEAYETYRRFVVGHLCTVDLMRQHADCPQVEAYYAAFCHGQDPEAGAPACVATHQTAAADSACVPLERAAPAIPCLARHERTAAWGASALEHARAALDEESRCARGIPDSRFVAETPGCERLAPLAGPSRAASATGTALAAALAETADEAARVPAAVAGHLPEFAPEREAEARRASTVAAATTLLGMSDHGSGAAHATPRVDVPSPPLTPARETDAPPARAAPLRAEAPTLAVDGPTPGRAPERVGYTLPPGPSKLDTPPERRSVSQATREPEPAASPVTLATDASVPASARARLAEVGIVLGALAVAAAFLLGLLGYHRVTGAAAAEHPLRARILALAGERPGIPERDLADALEVTRQAVRHHTRLLERAGLLVTLRVGARRLHYLPGQTKAYAPTDAQARVLEALGPVRRSQVEIASALGIGRPAAMRQLRRLVAEGLVTEERVLGRPYYRAASSDLSREG